MLSHLTYEPETILGLLDTNQVLSNTFRIFNNPDRLFDKFPEIFENMLNS